MKHHRLFLPVEAAMTMRESACFALIVLFASLGARAEKPAAWLTVPEQMGVNIHFTDPRPGEMDMLAAAGFKWVRMDLGWNGTEQKKGEYDFSAYDRLLKALDQKQMHALLILDYSNKLYDDGLSPFTDEGRAAFAKWATAAVLHLRGRGVLWEMYNEPNGGFWKPTADVNAYTQLAIAVGKALREAAPDESYIGPATAGMDFKYLQKCFDAGLLEYFSAVTVHPYRQDEPETVVPDYRKLRTMIDLAVPIGKTIPIMSGEWGYSERFKNQDEVNQGKTLAREFLTNAINGICLSIWYDWHDDGDDPKDAEHHFGIVHHEVVQGGQLPYKPKPAYFAAKTLAETFRGFHWDRPLLGGGADDYLALFVDEKGGNRKVAAWTTSRHAHDVVIQIQGKYHAVSYLGDALGEKTADDSGLHITLTDGPIYLSGN